MLFTHLKAMLRVSGLILTGVGFTISVQAQQSNEECAKKAQNPIADLISVPFQNNSNRSVKG
jgi:hypothetical protein